MLIRSSDEMFLCKSDFMVVWRCLMSYKFRLFNGFFS
jgi:hypothetical protein